MVTGKQVNISYLDLRAFDKIPVDDRLEGEGRGTLCDDWGWLFFFKILFIFRERGMEGEKHRLVASHMHLNQGLKPQPGHVPWQGIELATFCFAGQCPTNWAMLLRAEDDFSFFFFLFVFLRFYLFLERGGGRGGEKDQCVVASHAPPTGDLTCNSGMCPDGELNWWPIGLQAGTQSAEPHQPGLEVTTDKCFGIWRPRPCFCTYTGIYVCS